MEVPAAVDENILRGDEEMESLSAKGRVEREYGAVEHRVDVTDDQKVTRVTKVTASVCAARRAKHSLFRPSFCP